MLQDAVTRLQDVQASTLNLQGTAYAKGLNGGSPGHGSLPVFAQMHFLRHALLSFVREMHLRQIECGKAKGTREHISIQPRSILL